jgi:hypothetical protein
MLSTIQDGLKSWIQPFWLQVQRLALPVYSRFANFKVPGAQGIVHDVISALLGIVTDISNDGDFVKES